MHEVIVYSRIRELDCDLVIQQMISNVSPGVLLLTKISLDYSVDE